MVNGLDGHHSRDTGCNIEYWAWVPKNVKKEKKEKKKKRKGKTRAQAHFKKKVNGLKTNRFKQGKSFNFCPPNFGGDQVGSIGLYHFDSFKQ